MAMRSWIDLIGIYNYDNTVLDELVYPPELNGDTLKDNLLLDTAEMELLYPDALFLKKAIGIWSQKQLHIWQELYDTTQYEYNPIWNKDGTIQETITRDLAGTEDYTDTHNLQLKQTRDLKGTNDTTQTDSVYGFNSSSDAPSDKTVIDQDTTDTGSITDNDTGTLKRDRDTTDTGTITTERTEQGNIGLTSTQELINAQREVVKFNLYDVIIKDFKERFCLRLY